MGVCEKSRRFWIALLVLSAMVGVGVVTEAKTLFVANNGVDNPSCGDKKTPCRSISQAIANASAKDKIIVGPGRYGDLDGDKEFDGPAEEKAEVDKGCFCMIKIDKQISIESQSGAEATVLDAGRASVAVVRITASGVIFGQKRKGFTLSRGDYGLDISVGIRGVKVLGNVASANLGSGFASNGSRHVFSDNLASNNGGGFVSHSSGMVLTNNIARTNVDDGFYIDGGEYVIISNVAIDNGGDGFDVVGGEIVFKNNIASANGNTGFFLTGSGIMLTNNVAVANRYFGIEAYGGRMTINKSNIYGNNNQSWLGYTNCGLVNWRGVMKVENNFWGAATGPGADPADEICNAGAASTTLFTPFAAREFLIKLKNSTPKLDKPEITSTLANLYRTSVYALMGKLPIANPYANGFAVGDKALANGVYWGIKIYADGHRVLSVIVIKR